MRAAFFDLDARNGAARRDDGADVRASDACLRRLDLNPHTPDAMNSAIAQSAGASFGTFNRLMAIAARALGMEAVGV